MAPIIRLARPDEMPALYDIVLRTANNGGDATLLHRLPEVQGDVYLGPYVTFEPDLAFVLEDDSGAAGFVLGAFEFAPLRGTAEAGVVAADTAEIRRCSRQGPAP